MDKLARVFLYPPAWDKITAGIWIDALADIPIGVLCEAVDRYIREPAKEDGKDKRFPRPDQLRALLPDDFGLRRLPETVPEEPSYICSPEEAAERAERLSKLARGIRAAHSEDAAQRRPTPLYVSGSIAMRPNAWSEAWRKKVGVS